MSEPLPLLQVKDLTVEFDAGRGRRLKAVSDVSFNIFSGETLGLVGESGCGKSSLARAILQLPPPVSGRVSYRGREITRLAPKKLRRLRPQFQMVFQDSISAFNPLRGVGQAIAQPLKLAGKHNSAERKKLAREMMARVGLDPGVYDHPPHRFSGGQCQRLQIARCLMTRPGLLICDEPVSALDVSIQAQILNLLEDMRTEYGLTMLFISHDLAVVKNVSDRVAVMYLGRLCETAPAESLYKNPAHPYTAALLNSIPRVDRSGSRRKTKLKSTELPSPLAIPSGCRFHTRCPRARDKCRREEPDLIELEPGREAACHYSLSGESNIGFPLKAGPS